MRIHIDPIACDAHALCAELVPELIGLDDWGYPIVLVDRVPRDLETLAQRTVTACPTLAISVDEHA